MSKPIGNTKLKVITGYALLFLLSVIAGIFIYQQIIRLTVKDSGINMTSRKLFTISNTLTELYEAEALSNAFIQNGSNKTFKKYIQSIEQVENNIDSLKNQTHSLNQQIRIDSIHILLEEKMENLKELVKTKKTLSADKFYNQAIISIEASKDSIQEYSNIRKRAIITKDSSYIKPEKKRRSFWNIFSSKEKTDSTLKVTVSHHTVVDTINSTTLKNNTDSVVNILKSVWTDIRQQTENINKQINQQEYDIVNQSSHITEQLRRILNEYEKEEIYNSIYKIKQQEQVVNTTTTIIAIIAAAAFVLVLFFSFIILRDITKSQRYRKELETAQKYTDHLLKSREKLMLSVTHDIKSPLSSIIGYIELLYNTSINERQRYFLENMKSSSEHILNLVTNLLDFSKLENNKMNIETINFNPMQLFQEINDSFIPLAKNKKLLLSCKISEELNANYQGDALRIRQILVNLISNAIKYTTSGSVSLSAEKIPTEEKIILKVTDTGVGLTKDEQELIFQEFTRLASASAIEGTGLGLTITLKLVHLLHGQIFLDSTPGKGSCFTVHLPLKKIDTSTPPSTIKLSPLKILLVDDDILQLEMSAALLKNKGIEADITTNPYEVINKLSHEQYNLLFSDIQMPGMDGFQLICEIRKSTLPAVKNIPVIALSASSDKNETDYIQAGFTGYLNKPFTPAQLFNIIEGKKEKEEKKENVKKGTYTLNNINLFADHDEQTVQKILHSFIKDTQNHINQLKNNTDTLQTSHLAHKMLPMFRQLETSNIIPSLEQLESAVSKKRSPEEIKKLITEIIEQAEKLITEINNRQI